MGKRNFKFIQIPDMVLYDKKLSSTEKLIFGMALSLSNSKGYAYANNKYYSSRLSISPSTVSNSISKLLDLKYICIKNPKSTYRRIYINQEQLIGYIASENIKGDLLENSIVTSENSKNDFLNKSLHKRETLKEKEIEEKKDKGDSIALIPLKLSPTEKQLFLTSNIEKLKDLLIPSFNNVLYINEIPIRRIFNLLLKSLEEMKSRDILEKLASKVGSKATMKDRIESLLAYVIEKKISNLAPTKMVTNEDSFDPYSETYDNFIRELSYILRQATS